MAKQEHTSGLADSRRAPHALTSEAITAINRWSIFKAEIRIALARPAVNATMAPDSTSSLRESITPRPSPRPRCDTPPRLAVVDAVDAHHSFSCLHHPAAAPKTMPQEVHRRRKRRHRPIWDTQIWGFPWSSTRAFE
jgi:hypothetical protein